MAGLLLLLALCAVMAVASFLAGILPLAVSLSPSQLRLLSSLGVGILVGTSMIVIIPEGVGAAVSPGEAAHVHRVRSVVRRSPWGLAIDSRGIGNALPTVRTVQTDDDATKHRDAILEAAKAIAKQRVTPRDDDHEEEDKTHDDNDNHDHDHDHSHSGDSGDHKDEAHDHDDDHTEVPSFEIGISLILGFILMFLIDRLPKHASDSMKSSVPQTRHVSLDNLSAGAGPEGDLSSMDNEADGLMGSLTPSPRRARSLATTIGLVIHAAADGIAMGASATASDMSLSFVIFFAIMIHKAPAAFGLTAVLLKQGLSKRAARGHLIVFSLAAPVGALTTYMLVTILRGGAAAEGDDSGTWWTGMLLLFSGGTFLYVAMHAMNEDAAGHGGAHDHGSGMNGYAEAGVAQRKQSGPQMRDTMATMVGMLLPLLTQFGHHH